MTDGAIKSTGEKLYIRSMTEEEVNSVAIAWAAQEGWNPGLYDVEAFYAADPNGFLVGLLNDEPVACISVVKYKEDFSFLGFYIVKPGYRGMGYGMQIWNAGIKYLEGKNIGLDGVVDQQNNYKLSGFKYQYANIRTEGTAKEYNVEGLTDIKDIPFEKLAAYDRKFFPSVRDEFLKHWINQPEGKGVVSLVNGVIDGYGVIRKCGQGYKIGPLFAENYDVAEKIFLALQSHAAGSLFYLDLPDVNPDAKKLAEKYNMVKVFETARMHTIEAPGLPLNKIFGVTTFELG